MVGDAELRDRLAIRELIERWAITRDAADWERFAGLWHPDGVMMATWFQGPAADFVRVSREGFERGVRILHFLGGGEVRVAGERALAQTKMTISQRAVLDGVVCDVVCTGRFYDFLCRTPDGWRLRLRQPIYERDRLDPVDSGASVTLDDAELQQFPEGYRHLAYLQQRVGYAVHPNMPGLAGPEVQALYEAGENWLHGGRLGWPGATPAPAP
jgi:hypothetical protein